MIKYVKLRNQSPNFWITILTCCKMYISWFNYWIILQSLIKTHFTYLKNKFLPLLFFFFVPICYIFWNISSSPSLNWLIYLFLFFLKFDKLLVDFFILIVAQGFYRLLIIFFYFLSFSYYVIGKLAILNFLQRLIIPTY